MPLDTGVSTFSTAQDLLAKLDRDLNQLRRSPTDVDVCLNFFLTAEHLPEWHFNRDVDRVAEFRRQHALARACSKIAGGGMRFRISEKRPQGGVSSAATGAGVPSFAPVGRMSARPAGKLIELVLDVEPAEAADLGASISARELAERVVQFWRSQLAG